MSASSSDFNHYGWITGSSSAAPVVISSNKGTVSVPGCPCSVSYEGSSSFRFFRRIFPDFYARVRTEIYLGLGLAARIPYCAGGLLLAPFFGFGVRCRGAGFGEFNVGTRHHCPTALTWR
ncbi:MAG: hypothetical protein A2Y67_01245 [Candidatus Buchananbacteria bacterium RBG_13_39_9]|uniref:Uncharacterized protein n=1 Tax=Candidatus Buchananbacteria bacterium RBG_13_39_9 TaxID=1797531 RepID=A0A1G1XMI1_9BACT|nr:MAG: hypothetical protein A2Y67_01245 [Candidatus Buchananbacteria bacterium RBG_13_39_9]